MKVCITGWSHTKFGKLDYPDAETLIAEVASEAIEEAELEPADIDAIYLGAYNNGFCRQDFQSSLVSLAIPELRFTPATRIENACATGSAAIHSGLNAIRAGQARHVLVVGVEKMTALATQKVSEILLTACYVKEEADVEGGFAGVFAKVANNYFQKYGDKSDSLARIAAKNHTNGVNNPYAQIRKDLGFAFCNTVSEKNPIVAGPLRRTDCSLISDGAAAIVLSSSEALSNTQGPIITFRAAEQVNDFLPMSRRSTTEFAGAHQVWNDALCAADVTLDDLSFVETHDCFTIAELLEYEAMGLAKPGEGHRVIDDGITTMEGKLPVNPSGGLKAKGHPIGATGVSMHVLAAMQLSGTADQMQVPDALLAGIFNMGGLAVANYVSILERTK